MYTPRWLKKLDPFSSFGDRPECNREKLRDVLLDAMSERENTRIAFDTAVGRVSKEGEVYDRDGCSLGTYDLIVDSMGLHSPLRRHVVDDPVGKHYEGYVSFHGMVQNPDETFPEDMRTRFGEYGSVCVAGVGYLLFFQRYGAGMDDNRTACFYNVP